MRILIVKGQSQYGGTRLFADHAVAALRGQGHQAEVLDLGGVADGGPLIQAYRPPGPIDLIFTINILGEYRDHQGRSLSDLLGAPHVVWHTDYVFNQPLRLHGAASSTALLLVDPTQVDAVRSFYGPERFRHVEFFPHPAVGTPGPDDRTAAEFMERRPIGVLWSGSFVKADLPWADATGPARQILQDAFDLAVSVEWMPPNEALDTVLSSRGLDIHDPKNVGLRELANLIDRAVRTARRFQFLKAVAKTGTPLHICGAGWEPHLYRFKNATYEGEVDMTRMAELMSQSRVVLNTNGNFGAGSHERPFSASLAGAATFSDYSRYYNEVFEPGENIEFFRWKALDEGMGRLRALSSDPQRCFEYARSAKAATLASHTWDRRIETILRAGDAVR